MASYKSRGKHVQSEQLQNVPVSSMDGFGRHVVLSDLTQLDRICLTLPGLSPQEGHGTVHFGPSSEKELLYCEGDVVLNQTARDVVESPSVKIFKSCPDTFLCSLP